MRESRAMLDSNTRFMIDALQTCSYFGVKTSATADFDRISTQAIVRSIVLEIISPNTNDEDVTAFQLLKVNYFIVIPTTCDWKISKVK